MKRLLLPFCLFMTTGALRAQVGIGTATPHSSAQLDITATGRGLLIPRMTQANRPASPATGLMIYQTNNNPGYYYFDGSAWQMLGGSGWGLNGNSGTTSAHFIGTTDNKPLNFKVNSITAGRIDHIYSSVYFGYEAGKYMTTAGGFNTVFGHQALSSSSNSSYNTAIGALSLQSNGDGSSNVAVGFKSMNLNLSGYNNTALGASALESNTYGHRNTAVGMASMVLNTDGMNNTALGFSALNVSDHAHNNTAVGSWALEDNVSGGNNTAVGSVALRYLTTGNYNTAVGVEAGVDFGFGALSNTTAIGYQAMPTADNMVRIGNASVTKIEGAVTFSTPSDIRFKKDISPQTHGLDFIMQLQPLTYHYDVDIMNRFMGAKVKDDDAYRKAKQQKEAILYSGFSAQQVEEAARAIGYNFSGVNRPQNDKDHYSLDYATFVVPLVKAMQEQQKIIEALEERIKKLEQAQK